MSTELERELELRNTKAEWVNVIRLARGLEDRGWEIERRVDRVAVCKLISEPIIDSLSCHILPASKGITKPPFDDWVEVVNTSICSRGSMGGWTVGRATLMREILDTAIEIGDIVLCGPVKDEEQYVWKNAFPEIGWMYSADELYPITLYYPEGETDAGE